MIGDFDDVYMTEEDYKAEFSIRRIENEIFYRENPPAVLRLTLKKKWYDMILSGEKKEEYREVKRYWIQRLCNEVEYGMGGAWEGVFKKFNQVEFKNGYGKDAPTMLVEFKGLRIGEANPEWSDNWQGEVFAISLGAVLHGR